MSGIAALYSQSMLSDAIPRQSVSTNSNSRLRRANVLLSTVLLTIGLSIAPLSDPAATALEEEPFPGLIDSADLDEEIIAVGVVEDKSGHAVGAGQIVFLRAWPRAESLAKMSEGEAVKTVPIAYTRTEADGSFALRYSDRAILQRYENHEGIVDLEIVSILPSGSINLHSFSAPSTSLQSAKVTTDISQSAQKGDRLALGAPNVSLGATLEFDPGQLQASQPIEKACAEIRQNDIGNFWVTVGEGYSTSGVTMSFAYTSGSSSSLGVGISGSGSAGSYSASGTSSVSSSSTTSFPKVTGAGNRQWKTQFVYSKFMFRCWNDYDGSIFSTSYYARATSHAGGATAIAPTTPPTATNCASYTAGSTFTKSTTTAYEYATGVGSSGTLGVNLSARTGFSSSAKITFTFTSARKLCGSSGFPGGTPKRLVAKP